MVNKKNRQEAIDELTLALLYLTSFPDGEGSRFEEIAWKNYDFGAIDRLDGQELIVNPKRGRGGRRRVLTCHADKTKMYTKFGFRDLGESASVWGGERWHEMDIFLNW